MQKEVTPIPVERKVYQSPELKDLGKIGEVTNTNSTVTQTSDGGANSYNS